MGTPGSLQGGPGLTQTRASQRVLGAPSPSPDPDPWLRLIVANIYICRVNSQEGAGWAGEVCGSLDPADLGEGSGGRSPRTESQRQSSGTPPTSHTIPAEGDLNPVLWPPSPSCCVDRQPLLPGPQFSRGAAETKHETLGSGGGGCWGGHKARTRRWPGPVEAPAGEMRAGAVGFRAPGLSRKTFWRRRHGAVAVGMRRAVCVVCACACVRACACVCVCRAGQHLPGGGCGPKEVVQSGSQSGARACGPETSLELFGGRG